MKGTPVFSLLLLVVSFMFCCKSKNEVRIEIKALLNKQLDTLEAITANEFLTTIEKGSLESAQAIFKETRLTYKKVEWFTEYYAPQASKEINGAPLAEIETEESKVTPPGGFQVIEEHICDTLNSENRLKAANEIKSLLSSLKRVRIILENTEFTDAHIIDACKLEVFRIITMGITGFDTPVFETGVNEAATSLSAVNKTLSFYGENIKLHRLTSSAIKTLKSNSQFNSFDRIGFIKAYANPLTTEIIDWQKKLKIPFLKGDLALKNSISTLFDENALNVDFFTGSREAWISDKKINLGKTLFNDKVISGNKATCASCHKPQLAFTDGLSKSAALKEGQFVTRNAPTLNYAGFQQGQFYDLRSSSLENQVSDVIANPDEMHASVEEAVVRINKIPGYKKQFTEAFPTMEKEIKPRFVMIAIASYIRSLNPFNSSFDQYMRGNDSKMNKQEIHGFNLFMGKGKCGTCHFMPLFNGTAPPSFTNTEAEVLGVPIKPNSKIIDPDLGRYTHNKIDELKFAFKTPTLRNISLTAPYMHNGAFKTLEEVMEFYNKGGGAGLGIKLDNQTLPAEKLDLTKAEEQAIIAFLKTLTDN